MPTTAFQIVGVPCLLRSPLDVTLLSYGADSTLPIYIRLVVGENKKEH